MIVTAFFVFLFLVGFVALVVLGLLFLQARKRSNDLASRFHSEKAELDKTIRQWSDYAAAKEAEGKRLSPYIGIADADEKAKAMLADAQQRVNEAQEESSKLTSDATQQASSIIAFAQQDAESLAAATRAQVKQMKDQAQASLNEAAMKAAKIEEDAHKKATEIAGDAYKAMQYANLYEDTAKAMKNLIEGYGDQYLIPGRSLLDDLADDFGHLEAGIQLKLAREHTKLLISTGTATRCEYVEVSRREYAKNFVLDAFNGRVDSILSRVKHDNVGTLGQEIRDAFTMVNYNGKAFRDAKVTEEYLAARLEELKWAAVAQQLKLDERDEQRRIKEQIREEEKARRDYERALRDSAREEEVLKKAMEKAQQQIDQASAEQKEKYEIKLRELTLRLKEAEEKNQRALSMAQQTKQGHVYIISNTGSFGDNVYKIGLTRRLEPLDRIRELGDSSVPFEFDVHAMIFSEDAPALESQLHKHFLLTQMNKVNHRKEFFKADLPHIREEVTRLGLEAKWTMAALAREYHETLAIEAAIASDPAKKDAWIRRQLDLELATDYGTEDKAVACE